LWAREQIRMDPQLHGKRDGPGEKRNKRDIFHVS